MTRTPHAHPASRAAADAPVVLITGALAGIGRATALAFARDGARVVVSGRNDDAGRDLVQAIESLGADALYVRADVRREDDVRRLVDLAVERFGRLDAAVNNAGTEGTPGPVVAQTPETYAATFDTNVLGVLLSMKHELRVMTAQGGGSIVNVSSAYGKVGGAGASVYVASKHAVEGLTKAAALEVAASGVRVNAVAPGPIETGMLDRFTGHDPAAKTSFAAQMPVRRLGHVDEVAAAIVFVATGDATFMTGQSLSVDGGHTAA